MSKALDLPVFESVQKGQARRVLTRADVDAAATEAFQKGLAEGEVAAQQKADHRLQTELKPVVDQIQQALSQQQAWQEQFQPTVLTMLSTAIQRVAEHAAQQYPVELMEGLVKALLHAAGEQTRLTVSVHSQTRDVLMQVDQELFNGYKIELKSDDKLPLSGIQAQWKNGGATADPSILLAEIQTLLSRSGANPDQVAELSQRSAEATPSTTENTEQPAETLPEQEETAKVALQDEKEAE